MFNTTLSSHILPNVFHLFRRMVFRIVTVARKVGEGMAVQREWDLRRLNYFRFISLIPACAKSGNDHTLFVLGLVQSKPLSLIFPNYLIVLSMYLMLIFCRRNSNDGGESDQAATPTPSHG
jgi:hypothetical protein